MKATTKKKDAVQDVFADAFEYIQCTTYVMNLAKFVRRQTQGLGYSGMADFVEHFNEGSVIKLSLQVPKEAR